MFDHIGFGVQDFERSKVFYEKALAPLGLSVQMEVTREMTGGDAHCGFGKEGKPGFWIMSSDTPLQPRLHVAFVAENRAQVRAFYEAAIAAGAVDNGAPGLRPQYHPAYYGAFVLDPDGHNIEAVCHKPE